MQIVALLFRFGSQLHPRMGRIGVSANVVGLILPVEGFGLASAWNRAAGRLRQEGLFEKVSLSALHRLHILDDLSGGQNLADVAAKLPHQWRQQVVSMAFPEVAFAAHKARSILGAKDGFESL